MRLGHYKQLLLTLVIPLLRSILIVRYSPGLTKVFTCPRPYHSRIAKAMTNSLELFYFGLSLFFNILFEMFLGVQRRLSLYSGRIVTITSFVNWKY